MNLIEVKVKYLKVKTNGAVAKVTEQYLVDALSCTEAEARVRVELCPMVSSELNVLSVTQTKIADFFQSRALQLQTMQRAGQISDLREQVRFRLIPPQYIDGRCIERACDYIADFVYEDTDGNTIVEDTKGFRTPEYRIKRKLMLAVHGIQIKEL